MESITKFDMREPSIEFHSENMKFFCLKINCKNIFKILLYNAQLN